MIVIPNSTSNCAFLKCHPEAGHPETVAGTNIRRPKDLLYSLSHGIVAAHAIDPSVAQALSG
jgi:hypothetical protein